MAPNSTLIRDYATYGDLSQRDVYHRHKNQVIKEGAVENYFYHIDAGDVKVNTVVEKVSLTEGASKYEVYTKPTSGTLSNTEGASMMEITNAKTIVRSLEFEAAGNISLGNLAVTGASNLNTLSTSGLATLDAATVTGQTTMSNFSATGNGSVTGTLGVTGTTSLSTLSTSGLATLNTATVTGDTSLASVTASGNASITGNLTVTGNTGMSNFTASGSGNVTGTLDVTGATSLSTLSTSGNVSIAGNLTVSGNTSLSDTQITGSLTATGNTTIALGESGTLLVSGNGDVNFGTSDVFIAGNVIFTGSTTIENIALGGSGDIDMNKNSILNVTSLSNENVRTSMDNTSRAIYAETLESGVWSSTTTTTHDAFTVDKNLIVTGTSTLSTLDTSGLATLNTATVTGDTSLASVTASGNASISGNLTVLGTSSFTGPVTFGGGIYLSNNSVMGVSTLTKDNVRVFLDNTARSVQLQTFDGSVWNDSLVVNDNSVSTTKALTTTSTLVVGDNLTCNGAAVTFGNVSSQSNVTVFGNLEIKGTATNTRIESNIVQIGDKNIELGFLEIDTLANLDGAGLTVGGPGGSIAKRPNFNYSSTYDAWQPNIDIVNKGPSATDIAKMSLDGSLVSTLVANANVFTKIDSSSINFGDKWRFKHDTVNDTVELQHYESNAWVTKFTYTS
jgi:hypothetical protein